MSHFQGTEDTDDVERPDSAITPYAYGLHFEELYRFIGSFRDFLIEVCLLLQALCLNDGTFISL